MNLPRAFVSTDASWWRHGAIGGAGIAAFVLLAVFYAVVAGAVERGASRRADLGARTGEAAVTTMAAEARTIKLARATN